MYPAVLPALVFLSGNRVQGLAEGKTRIIAKSSENPTIADTLDIVVLSTQKIDSVREKTGYASGAEATILGTIDGGANWTVLGPFVTYSGTDPGGAGWTMNPMFQSIHFP